MATDALDTQRFLYWSYWDPTQERGVPLALLKMCLKGTIFVK